MAGRTASELPVGLLVSWSAHELSVPRRDVYHFLARLHRKRLAGNGPLGMAQLEPVYSMKAIPQKVRFKTGLLVARVVRA